LKKADTRVRPYNIRPDDRRGGADPAGENVIAAAWRNRDIPVCL